MGGSMARKESRATNGHPAELKKEEDRPTAVCCTAVSFVMGTRLSAGTSRFSAKSPKDMQAKQCRPKIGFSKKKSTILPTKYSAFLVENSGIEPLTSCMPCKRSPEPP